MSSRIEFNPQWPISALFKLVDDRTEVQKLFHVALTKLLDGKASPALTMLQNISIEANNWAVSYNLALALHTLGHHEAGNSYFDLAERQGATSYSSEALVLRYWTSGQGAEAIQRTSSLGSPVLRQMYHHLISNHRCVSWEEATHLKQEYLRTQRPPLRVLYFMTATNLCGGSKVLLDHAHQLQELGQHVEIVSFDSLPDWYDVTVPFTQTDFSLASARHLAPVDIAVSGFFWLNYLTLSLAPRTYHFAQGDEMTFTFDTLNDVVLKDVLHQFHSLPNKQLAVSTFLGKAIATHFERDQYQLVPNAVENFFIPDATAKRRNQIMIVGSETNTFKNVPRMLEACRLLRSWGYDIHLVWVSSRPRSDYTIECEFYEQPSRETLARLYASSEVFLSASDYEAFALTVLEAMKSGTAVVTSDNGGIRDYVINETNALVVSPHTPENLAKAVARLLDDEELRTSLTRASIKTAEMYSWRQAISNLIDLFYEDLAYVWPLVP